VTVSSWQPKELLNLITREPLAVMRKGVGAAPFLIVRLDDFSNDLQQGLAAADQAVSDKRSSRAIRSTLQISVDMVEQLRMLRTQEVSVPTPATNETANANRAGFPVPEWLGARCYVVRLSNRSEGGAPLSIGRDPRHNIVLQHPSVSALHAYITVGAELSLRDAKSRNGTLVNGVPAKGVVTLNVGDKIKLGAVQAVLCSADEVWQAVR
jgi:FHA domain